MYNVNYNLMMEIKDKALAHKIFISCVLLAQLVLDSKEK